MFYSALIGKPVDHSISPILFNYLAKCAKLEYGHIKINIESNSQLADTIQSLRILGFCGINVTLPYKLDIIKHLDRISPESKKIGAVNTVVFKNRKAIGYNTDACGAISAIESKLKRVGFSDRVLVIGAGGAARAIIYSLYQKTKNIVILNRDLREAKLLSSDISNGRIIFQKLSDKNVREYLRASNIIVNATSVGMYPEVNSRIISRSILKGIDIRDKYFFDAIFNPYKTKFLQDAENGGAKVCPGTYMMIYQAIEAFNLWTGIKLIKIKIEEINDILTMSL